MKFFSQKILEVFIATATAVVNAPSGASAPLDPTLQKEGHTAAVKVLELSAPVGVSAENPTLFICPGAGAVLVCIELARLGEKVVFVPLTDFRWGLGGYRELPRGAREKLDAVMDVLLPREMLAGAAVRIVDYVWSGESLAAFFRYFLRYKARAAIDTASTRTVGLVADSRRYQPLRPLKGDPIVPLYDLPHLEAAMAARATRAFTPYGNFDPESDELAAVMARIASPNPAFLALMAAPGGCQDAVKR